MTMHRPTMPDKPRLTVAGPGAGKTHSMVDEIVVSLDKLRPHRQLAAVTYTNAAARTIRARVFDRIPCQPNIFIGTIHAFLNRFILQPFATVFDELPEERIFGAIDIGAIATKGGTKKLAPGALNAAKSRITNTLLDKGVVPYDAMLALATSLLKRKDIRQRVSRRLQFLFVDEFQDTDTRQFLIFEEIRKATHTAIYVVGDPEQYISGFTYGTRGRQIPAFERIPFFKFCGKAEETTETLNRRSNGELVDFANQFRDDLKQNAKKPHRGEDRVLFIPECDLKALIERFRILSNDVEHDGEEISRLYLSFANKTFDAVRDEFGIVPVSNDSRGSPTLLGDALEILSLSTGRSERRIQEEFELTRLQIRRLGVTILRRVQSQEVDEEILLGILREKCGEIQLGSRLEPIRTSLSQLTNVMNAAPHSRQAERCSSINKAKGLEADAALLVARTPAELSKWLTIDRIERSADKQDKCRLGYVAITRPRELLCMACLKPLDKAVERLLGERGVKIV